MQRDNRIILFVVAIAVMAVTGIAAARAFREHQAVYAQQVASQPRLLRVAPAAVIGPRRDFRGNAAAPYTLIEFADYQCPPCRAVNQKLPAILSQHKGTLRFAFRNFPLSFHAYALPAAVAAEAAREQGRFWPMHDALFAADLGDARLDELARAQGVDVARFDRSRATTARAAVRADVQEATTLKLPGTPSFLLCCPDGRVVQLADISQLSRYCPTSS